MFFSSQIGKVPTKNRPAALASAVTLALAITYFPKICPRADNNFAITGISQRQQSDHPVHH